MMDVAELRRRRTKPNVRCNRMRQPDGDDNETRCTTNAELKVYVKNKMRKMIENKNCHCSYIGLSNQ